MEARQVSYAIAKPSIQPGDLLLYRGNLLIARIGRSIWSHAGIADEECGELRVLDTLQFRGPRSVSLLDQVKRNPGQWDYFSIHPEFLGQVDRAAVVQYMRDLVAKQDDYGWWNLLYAGLRHLPVARMLMRPEVNDLTNGSRPPFCSQAVANGYCLAGTDPVPHLSNRLTEPADLARSFLFQYQCSLVP